MNEDNEPTYPIIGIGCACLSWVLVWVSAAGIVALIARACNV